MRGMIVGTWLLILVGMALLCLPSTSSATIDLSKLPQAMIRPEALGTGDPAPQKTIPPASSGSPFTAKQKSGDDNERVTVPIEELTTGVCQRLSLLKGARQCGVEREVALGYLVSQEAVHDLQRLRETNCRSLIIDWRAELGTPRAISGNDLLPGFSASDTPPAARAARFLAENKGLLRIDQPSAEFVPFKLVEGVHGFSAVRFQQYFQGLELWAHDLVVRFDPSGKVIGFSGCYRPTPEIDSIDPLFGPEAATAVAIAGLADRDGIAGVFEESRLLLYPFEDNLRLSWRIVISAGRACREEVFIDALSGEFLHAITLIRESATTGEGTDLSGQTRTLGLWDVGGTYNMIDTRKAMYDAGASTMPDDPKGAIWTIHANHTMLEELYHVSSSDVNDWTSKENAVSAATYTGYFYDYINSTFGRNSYDNEGRTITSIVDVGSNYNNAFWNGQAISFGNGDNTTFSDLAGALDVVCHELGHAVVEFTANLVYEFQPGSLNEHYADVFGTLVEWDADEANADWLLGEDVTTPGTPGDCLRNMEDPDNANVAFGGDYPSHMSEYHDLPASNDHGGVHTNNTIPSRAFVIVAQNESVGREKAAQIWYRALTQSLNRNSQFIDLRIGVIAAATELYGETEATVVTDAFDTVGITAGEETPEQPDLPDNSGDDFIAVKDISNGHIYRVTTDWSETLDISLAAIGNGGRPSFTDDGSAMVWVGADGHLYYGPSDGTAATQISDDPEWWSAALSADGRYLAATTLANDGNIHVFDLETQPVEHTAFQLYQQNDGGQTDVTVEYADVMEFAVAGDFIIYDALNSSPLGGGGTYEYWDINLLRLEDSACFRVFQPLPQGEQIGNPTLAQNQDNILAFDYVDGDENNWVIAYDLQTNVQGEVTNNYSHMGRPTFSGDDSQIYYQYPATCKVLPTDAIWSVSLLPDGLTGAGDDEPWGCYVALPVWMTLGERPAPVMQLQALEGNWSENEVTITWQISATENLSGFHLENSPVSNGPFVQRTDEMIPVTSGSTIYHFTDNAPEVGGECFYRVIGIDRAGGRRELGQLQLRPDTEGKTPLRPLLLPNTPNPFGQATLLRFVLPELAAASQTDLKIFDLQGRLVAHPVAGELLGAGEHRIAWQPLDQNGTELATGIYFMRLEAGAYVTRSTISVIR